MKCQDDYDSLKSILDMHKIVFNFASPLQFQEKKNSLVVLHSKIYYNIRKQYPDIPSQVIIKAEQECLSSYKSTKSNKHKLKKPIIKNNLSMRLDKRLYSKDKTNKYSIRITTTHGRQSFNFVVYPKLKELLNKYQYSDPLIYENNGKLFISFCFENKPKEPRKQKLAIGIDLGIRRTAATSEGKLIIDKKFNGNKRKLRHLKDCLKSKNNKSSRKHLIKLRHKEYNQNKNQTHLVANEVLKTNADTIVLENLKGIKKKKNKYQNKRSIGQVPLFELRRIITYKAENAGKTVTLVSPYNTSKTDSVTGKVEGERRGCRFYSKNGLIYDADINASINIAKLSKLPVSQTSNLTYGQALVNMPIVCKSSANRKVLQAHIPLG
jgi:IS605 OrfB family transposase